VRQAAFTDIIGFPPEFLQSVYQCEAVADSGDTISIGAQKWILMSR